MAYRYKTSDASTLTDAQQAEYGNLMDTTKSDELTLTGGRKVTRYADTPASTTTGAPDATAAYYEGIKAQSVMPDEARRAALRSQAQSDVQTQISAINSAYATLVADERMRQQKLAAQGAAQVSGIGRLSGLGGSSVQAARQGTQATLASEQERQAVAVLQAKQAQEEAAARGVGTASADQRFAQEQALASTAQGQYGAYIQGLANKSAAAPIEVGGYLVDASGKVIFAPPDKATEAKSYTLSPGQKVYGADGALIAENNSTENKMTTLSPGQVLVGADGKAIYTVPGDPKTYTLSEGQAVFDSTGGLVASVAKPQTFTLNPGQTVYDAHNNIIASAGPEKKVYTLQPGESAYDQAGNLIATAPVTESKAPTTMEIDGKKYQFNPTTRGWDQVKVTETPLTQEQATQQVASLQGIVNLSDELLNNQLGQSGAAGLDWLSTSVGSTVAPGAKVAFLASASQLIDQKTLDALITAKAHGATFGALSEGELNVLRNAATQLNYWAERDKSGKITGFKASPGQVADEIRKVKAQAQKAVDVAMGKVAPPKEGERVFQSGNGSQTTNPQTMTTPDGKVYELGPDGTYYPKANGGAGTPVFASVPISTTVNIPASSHLASLNSNPGNLRYVGQPGASQGQGGFAMFPTPRAGYVALWNDVKAKQTGNTSTGLGPNSTLKDLVYVYAPPGENDSALYVQQLASRLGLDPNTPIGRIDTNAIAREIARKESSTVIG